MKVKKKSFRPESVPGSSTRNFIVMCIRCSGKNWHFNISVLKVIPVIFLPFCNVKYTLKEKS